jgi:hypothetical protein
MNSIDPFDMNKLHKSLMEETILCHKCTRPMVYFGSGSICWNENCKMFNIPIFNEPEVDWTDELPEAG